MTPTAKVLLLGSGELGREFVISAKRLGAHVIACDAYAGAPAMQVADQFEVFSMLDGAALGAAIDKHQPDFIVPEVEAIRTEVLKEYEERGSNVVPSARATLMTMNRDRIREVAASELGLPTSTYLYAESLEEMRAAVAKVGLPCVVKPVMSSSGKGQSLLKSAADMQAAWDYSQAAGRVGAGRIIVEGFIDFDYEITLLTVRAVGVSGDVETFFCDPIGHVQVNGDYVESWQPMAMTPAALQKSRDIARAVTGNLGGRGIFGVELFVKGDMVWFSEVSPRPHDTGLVTLATQRLSEFELHARAILGLPVDTGLRRPGASAVIYGGLEEKGIAFEGVADALQVPESDLRLFGKPESFRKRRMGVAVANADGTDTARQRAKLAASRVKPVKA